MYLWVGFCKYIKRSIRSLNNFLGVYNFRVFGFGCWVLGILFFIIFFVKGFCLYVNVYVVIKCFLEVDVWVWYFRLFGYFGVYLRKFLICYCRIRICKILEYNNEIWVRGYRIFVFCCSWAWRLESIRWL